MTLYIWTRDMPGFPDGKWLDISHATKREHAQHLWGARAVEQRYGRCTALTKPKFPDECFGNLSNCSCKTVFKG